MRRHAMTENQRVKRYSNFGCPVALEGRWFVVAVAWWCGARVARSLFASGRSGVAVVSALGGDAVGAVWGAGARAFGHHGGALGAVVLGWVGFGGGHAADRVAQAGEQQRAAGGGDVGVPAGCGEDQRPVGQL